MVADIRNIKKQVLPNGLTILTEEMQHIRSVSIGIWVRTGSRHEEPAVNGISHFVEHMVFKGTKNRTALDIARQMDSIGGNMDAFTGKETICFNAKVLDEHLPIALDVLSDLVLNPTFDAKDIHREKGVILEEIKMDEDNPDYLVHEIFTQNFWKGHSLGKPILGTKETVKQFNQEAVFAFYKKRFAPNNLVISAAGSLNHEQFVKLVAERFSGLQAVPNGFHGEAPQVFARIVTRNKKALEQVQICMGAPSPHISHEKRYVSYILNTLLGGGMSSRLFQKIREEQGLVYSIYSDLNPYSDTGSLCVYAGTSKESAPKVVAEIGAEFRRLKDEVISNDEMRRVKDQLKGNLMLSLESSTARMSNLARQDMYFERFFDLDEIIARVESVTAAEIQEMADTMFRSDSVAVTVLGNLDGMKLSRDLVAC
ncbi:MAG TPA: pitrilysin family protein [Terriglobales bacterium]|nr:pitrilysin family protein [Terriglobales bacterium]